MVKTTSRETRGTACVEAQAFILHAMANRFEHRKSAVSFVQVKNAGRDSHRFQCAEAADAEQQLLADAGARRRRRTGAK